MNQQFQITAVRGPGLDDAEVRRRLSRVYALILDYRAKSTTEQPESDSHIGSEKDVTPLTELGR